MREAKAEDRARVKALLITPLAGLGRKRGLGAEAHEAALVKLTERLAYMTAQNLRGLHDLVLRHAGKGIWPDAALIIAWAYALQCPPPAFSDYPRSLIQSAMGRQARDEGWAVELYQVARRLGPPPGKYIIAQLRQEAEANRRRRERVRERIGVGRADPEEQHWLARWHADLAEVEALQSAAKNNEEGQAA
ncbi:hypothetical protein [Phaeovulum sp. W22_SRMD_FR3]|uniref:hypothetical protein n=1 Tax=Phaeovulum sp. W22_SRMD_FR3 TaxID=3240274 RepID=UPI003F9675AF